MLNEKIYITSAVRTPIGGFSGSLAGFPPSELAKLVAAEAVKRSGIEGHQVGNVVFGHVINTEPRDMYLSRYAAVQAGIPVSVPAMNVNRLCGSGAQAIASGVQSLALGDANVALVGGAECMSRGPHATQGIRHGQKMGNLSVQDMMIGALHDPFGHGHMGITAENIAAKHGISRDQQDTFAIASHSKAANAIDQGYFTSQILPIEINSRKGTTVFDTDEHVRRDVTADGMSSLRAAFQKNGSVTAGNASGINDGAAALVIMTQTGLDKTGAKPIAEIVGYAHAGVEPELMGLGPVPAVQSLSKRTGIAISDFDIVESNEAFAAQACAVTQLLELDEEKVNPNGGAVGLGHPVGATGAILAVKMTYELQRTGKSLGLVTMCIGGGQGIALAMRSI